MRACVTIALAAALSLTDTAAQEAFVDRLSVNTEVIQCALRNFQLRGLYRTGRWAFGLHGGYRPRFGDQVTIRENVGIWGGYTLSNYQNGVYQAINVGPILRYHVGRDRRGWLELEWMYRFWWYDRRYVVFDGWGTSFAGIRSEEHHVRGWKLLWGGTTTTGLHLGPGMRLIFEGYGGFGCRRKDIRWTMHEGTVDGVTVKDRDGWNAMLLPTIHIGFRMGLDRAVRLRERDPG